MLYLDICMQYIYIIINLKYFLQRLSYLQLAIYCNLKNLFHAINIFVQRVWGKTFSTSHTFLKIIHFVFLVATGTTAIITVITICNISNTQRRNFFNELSSTAIVLLYKWSCSCIFHGRVYNGIIQIKIDIWPIVRKCWFVAFLR